MIIVGLTGFKRCGKTASAEILEQHFGFKTCGFADALRSMAYAVNPMISIVEASNELLIKLRKVEAFRYGTVFRYADLVDHFGYDHAKEIPDFRRFLQRLGTEGVRGTFGPTAWVDALAYRLKEESPARIAIFDVRFHSEAEWVIANGGTIWRVERPGWGGDDPHPSEADIPHLPALRVIRAETLSDLESLVITAAVEAGFGSRPS